MTNESPATMRLYSDLAPWWPILSPPEDYADAADFYARLIKENCQGDARTVLELGSGGGNNASHMKRHFELMLVDAAPGMLAVSRALNPECEHLQRDMRSVRLKRQFDAVFVQDAIGYMITEADLRRAFHTAWVHCRPGGVALFCPDYVRETFKPATRHGGHDAADRSLRYLEWTWDPDLADTTFRADMVYVLREPDGQMRSILETHTCGLFPHADWLRWLEAEGFAARAIPSEHGDEGNESCWVFVGVRPAT